MKEAIFNIGSPDGLEAKRILEIRSLTYLERLERLMAIIEISHTLKTGKVIQKSKK